MSLSSLCPWLRALKLALPHSHSNEKKKKKEKVFFFFNVFCNSPFSLPPSPLLQLTHTNTQVHKHSLKACIHLSKKQHGEVRRDDGMHGNAGVHKHKNTYTLHPTHSFSAHTPLNLSVCHSFIVYFSTSPSLWTPGVLFGFHPCSIFILILKQYLPTVQ